MIWCACALPITPYESPIVNNWLTVRAVIRNLDFSVPLDTIVLCPQMVVPQMVVPIRNGKARPKIIRTRLSDVAMCICSLNVFSFQSLKSAPVMLSPHCTPVELLRFAAEQRWAVACGFSHRFTCPKHPQAAEQRRHAATVRAFQAPNVSRPGSELPHSSAIDVAPPELWVLVVTTDLGLKPEASARGCSAANDTTDYCG